MTFLNLGLLHVPNTGKKAHAGMVVQPRLLYWDVGIDSLDELIVLRPLTLQVGPYLVFECMVLK